MRGRTPIIRLAHLPSMSVSSAVKLISLEGWYLRSLVFNCSQSLPSSTNRSLRFWCDRACKFACSPPSTLSINTENSIPTQTTISIMDNHVGVSQTTLREIFNSLPKEVKQVIGKFVWGSTYGDSVEEIGDTHLFTIRFTQLVTEVGYEHENPWRKLIHPFNTFKEILDSRYPGV